MICEGMLALVSKCDIKTFFVVNVVVETDSSITTTYLKKKI